MLDLNKIYDDKIAIIGIKKDIQLVCDFLDSKGFKIREESAKNYPSKVWYGATIDYNQNETMICFSPKTGLVDGQKLPYMTKDFFIENNSFKKEGYTIYTVDDLKLNKKDS